MSAMMLAWRAFAVIVAVLVLVVSLGAEAISIKWTGIGGDSQWTNKINWSPDQVPTISDDVVIRCGSVQVTIAAGVNSLTLGGEFSCSANLTVFNTFAVGAGTMQVVPNGLLILNSGLANVMGTINITGSLQFYSGTAQGSWDIAATAGVDMGGEAEKTFVQCNFVCRAATVSLSGLVTLNHSGIVTFSSGRVLAAEQLIIQAPQKQPDDGHNVLDLTGADFSFSGTTFQVMAPTDFGNVTLIAGNISLFDSVTFPFPLRIPQGSVVQAFANASFFQLSGDGVFSTIGLTVDVDMFVSMATVVAGAGILNITGTGSTITSLIATGGTVVFDNTLLTVERLHMGSGAVDLGAASTLVVDDAVGFAIAISGGFVNISRLTQSLSSSGDRLIILSTAMTVTESFTLVGNMNIEVNYNFPATASLTIEEGATMTISGSSGQLVGGPVTNKGVLNMSGAVTWANIQLQGTGSLTCSGQLAASAGSLTQAGMHLVGEGTLRGSGGFQVDLPVVTAPSFVSVILGPNAFCLSCPSPCANISSGRINAIVLSAVPSQNCPS